jgi:hypothetical protein
MSSLIGSRPIRFKVWPERRFVAGCSSSGEPPILLSLLCIRRPRFRGKGIWRRSKAAVSNREEFQAKLKGARLRKQGARRGLDIRADTFVSGFSEFEMKDRMFE